LELRILELGWQPTGGLLLEILGPEGAKRADALANEIKNVIGGTVNVSRPVKSGEIRVSGIDLSVGPEELTRALAAGGECSTDSIRLGPIRRTMRGVQSVWARCPLTAAFKLAEKQKLQIGWSSVRVELLKTRPIQCFKCWHYGHVRGNCKSNVDRGGSCFRCGEKTHTIRDCSAVPRCVVCEDNGYGHSHRLGSIICESLRACRDSGNNNNNGRG